MSGDGELVEALAAELDHRGLDLTGHQTGVYDHALHDHVLRAFNALDSEKWTAAGLEHLAELNARKAERHDQLIRAAVDFLGAVAHELDPATYAAEENADG